MCDNFRWSRSYIVLELVRLVALRVHEALTGRRVMDFNLLDINVCTKQCFFRVNSCLPHWPINSLGIISARHCVAGRDRQDFFSSAKSAGGIHIPELGLRSSRRFAVA